jgi:tetratricopeptide (TPR) repeat protein
MKYRLSAPLAALILLLVCGIASQAQSPAQDAFKLGLACPETDYDCQITNFTKVIELDAAVPQAYLNRGYAYRLKGSYDLAIADFTKAIELKPDYELAYGNRSNVYLTNRNFDLALSDINKVIQLKPDNAAAYNDRGFIYRGMGNKDLAQADFDKAIQLYGDSPKAFLAYFNRGLLRCSQGCSELAFADYNKAIQLNPNFAEAYVERGSIYDIKRRFDLAVADYNKALQLKPDLPRAYNGLGWVKQQQGLFELAIADYTTAIRLDPNYATAYCNRGVAYAEIGEYDRAIADDTKALELDPNLNDEIYRSRALAYFYKNDNENAYRDTVVYLKRNGIKGDGAPYGIMIGYLALRKTGGTSRGETFLRGWLKLLKPADWSTQVLKYFDGQMTAAELLALANDNDKQTEAHAYIGEILLSESKKEEAFEHFVWVRNNGNKTFVEYHIAIEELKR